MDSRAPSVGISDPDGRTPKRLKTIKACAQCTTAKTRCDDHTSTGCGRCTKLNKQCSLREDLAYLAHSVGRYNGSAGPAGQDDVAARRMNELEARVAYLEGQMSRQQQIASQQAAQPYQQQPRGLGSTPNGLTGGLAMSNVSSLRAEMSARSFEGTAYMRPDEYMPDGYDLVSMLDFKEKGPQRRPMEERSGAFVDVRGFPDLVLRGICTRAQVQAAFHTWKHQFTTITPLAPFLLTTSPLPSHPFVVATIVSQTDLGRNPAVIDTVNNGFARLMAGDVNVEAMMGLLILAIDGQRHSPLVPSPIRAIAAAYEIGKAAGLETMARQWARMDTGLTATWSAEKYEELLLWETVKQYYNVLHLQYTRIDSLSPSSLPLFAACLPAHYQPVISHLSIIDAIHVRHFRLLDMLNDFDTQALYSIPDISPLVFEWNAVRSRENELFALFPSDPRTSLFIQSTQISLCIRILHLTHQLPTPINPAILAPLIDTWGTELCRVSADFLGNFLEWDFVQFPIIPHFFLCRFMGAVIMFSIAHVTPLRHSPSFFFGDNIDLAGRAKARLIEMGGLAAYVIERFEGAFEELTARCGSFGTGDGLSNGQTQTGMPPAGMSNGGVAGMPGPDEPIDLAAWSWLFEGVGV